MNSFIKFFKKGLLSLFAVLIFLGAFASLGFTAFGGSLLVTVGLSAALSLGVASLAFFLASSIEGQILLENIKSALTKQLDGNFIRNTAIKRYLYGLIVDVDENGVATKPKNLEDSPFLNDYYVQKHYVHRLSQHHAHTKAEKAQHKRARQTLKRMEKRFIELVLSKQLENSNEFPLKFFSQKLQAKFTEDLPKVRKGASIRQWLGRSMWLVYIAAAINTMFTSAASAQTAVVAIEMLKHGLVWVSVATSSLIWPLGILAGLGMAYLAYNAVTDMIANDSIQQSFRAILKEFKKPAERNWLHHIVRCGSYVLANVILWGLAIFATLATSNTWFILAAKGASMIPLLQGSATLLSYITLPAVLLSTLLFGIENSLRSFRELLKFSPTKLAKKKLAEIREGAVNLWQTENILQIINPFRLALKVTLLPLTVATFFGHVISIGFTTDRLGKLPPELTTTLCAGAEGATDTGYFLSLDEAIDPKKSIDFRQPQGHGHSHNLIEQFFNFVTLPVRVLSVLWAWSAGWLGYGVKRAYSSLSETTAPATPLSLKETWSGDHHHCSEPTAPELSDTWVREENTMRINKRIDYYTEARAYEKAFQLQQVRDLINKSEQVKGPQSEQSVSRDDAINAIPPAHKSPSTNEIGKTLQKMKVMEALGKQRSSLFNRKQTDSQRFLQSVIDDPLNQRLAFATRSA